MPGKKKDVKLSAEAVKERLRKVYSEVFDLRNFTQVLDDQTVLEMAPRLRGELKDVVAACEETMDYLDNGES